MARPETGDVTRLFQSRSGGDKQALGELVPYVYRELRLVDQTLVQSPSRAQFFAIAAKRGGGNIVTLEEGVAMVQQQDVDLIALDWALAPAEQP